MSAVRTELGRRTWAALSSPLLRCTARRTVAFSQLPSVPETRRRPEGHTGPRVPLRGRETRGGRGRAVFRAPRPRTSRDKRDKRGSKISANFAVDWCPTLGGASGKLRRTRFACYRRQRKTPFPNPTIHGYLNIGGTWGVSVVHTYYPIIREARSWLKRRTGGWIGRSKPIWFQTPEQVTQSTG